MRRLVWVDSYKLAEIYRMPDLAVCCSVLQCVAVCCSVLPIYRMPDLVDPFRKLANNYRALLRKMTCKDKASYESLLPCMNTADCFWSVIHSFNLNLQSESPWTLCNGTSFKRHSETFGDNCIIHCHLKRRNDTLNARRCTTRACESPKWHSNTWHSNLNPRLYTRHSKWHITPNAIACEKNTPNGIGCTNRSDLVIGVT